MSRIYCCSDIHGCIHEFDYALSLITGHLSEDNTKLVLLGDYIHGGSYSKDVLERIIDLRNKWGSEKIIVLCGNHEDMAVEGFCPLFENNHYDEKEDYYISWLQNLPRYYTEGNTIFVHAGIDEEAGDFWEWETDEITMTEKYPAETGRFSTGQKIVAGHVYTSEISGNRYFHDIYYDGMSHYYIDGDVLTSGVIPVLMVDTETDEYYRVTENGEYLILPYDEDY